MGYLFKNHRRKIIFLLFIVLSILPFYKIFTVNFVDGYDFLHYFYRIYALESMIKQGVLLPRILPDGTFGYGSPVFSMMWGLPLYLGAILHMVGFSYPFVFKLLILIPSVLGALGLYFWLKGKYGFLPSVVASIVYIWVPYRFLDSLIRYSIGELFFLAFLPWVLFFVDHVDSRKNIIFGGIVTSFLIYSHQGLSLIALIMFLIYCSIGYFRKRKFFFRQIVILANGLLLTTFYWLPLLFYIKLLNIQPSPIESKWFPPLIALIRSKWEGGFINGQYLIMSFEIGLVHLFILLLFNIYIFYRLMYRKKTPLILIFYLVIFWLSIFFMQPVSAWFWANIPYLSRLQFPFRLLIFPMFISSVAAAYLLSLPSKKFLYLFSILLIMGVIYENRNHLGVLNKPITMQEISSYEGTYFVGNDLFPYNSVLNMVTSEKSKQERKEFSIISGEGKVISEKRENFRSVASVDMETPGIVSIRRFYFPGWQMMVNDKEVKSESNLILEVPLNSGRSEVVAEYHDPEFVKLATLISIITLIINIFFYLKYTHNSLLF